MPKKLKSAKTNPKLETELKDVRCFWMSKWYHAEWGCDFYRNEIKIKINLINKNDYSWVCIPLTHIYVYVCMYVCMWVCACLSASESCNQSIFLLI